MTYPTVLYPEIASPTSIDLPTSRKLAAQLQTVNKACYDNALRALPWAPTGTRYMEGTVVTEYHRPMEHAWLVMESGVVIDPTPTYCRPDVEPRTYFTGPSWTKDEIWSLLARRRRGIIVPIFQVGTTLTPHTEEWMDGRLAMLRHVAAVRPDMYGTTETNDEIREVLEIWLGRHWAEHVLAMTPTGNPASARPRAALN